MRTCTTSTVWRLGSPRAFKAKLQAVMVHQAPSACFCGVGLHKDFVDSWNPSGTWIQCTVSVLEDRDGSGNLFVRILLDCLICILGDREGRRENIGKTLPSTCFYMFLRSFTSAVFAAVNHVQMFATSSLIFHGFYSELGISECLSGRIWLKKTSTLSDHFNRSTMAFGPESEASWQVSREGIALSGFSVVELWYVCKFLWYVSNKCWQYSGGKWAKYLMSHAKVGGVSICIQRLWTCLDCIEYTFELWTIRELQEPARTREQVIHLSFIIFIFPYMLLANVGWCRMSVKHSVNIISFLKVTNRSAADCGQSILDRLVDVILFEPSMNA